AARRALALPLHAAARGLAVAAARPAPDAFDLAPRARARRQSVEHHASSTTTRWRTLKIIPRIAGVSCSDTRWFRRRKPSPRSVARWRRSKPIWLFTQRTEIFLLCAITRSAAAAPAALRGCAARAAP